MCLKTITRTKEDLAVHVEMPKSSQTMKLCSVGIKDAVQQLAIQENEVKQGFPMGKY